MRPKLIYVNPPIPVDTSVKARILGSTTGETDMTKQALIYQANAARKEWLRVAAFDDGAEAARTRADYVRALEALHLGLVALKQAA